MQGGLVPNQRYALTTPLTPSIITSRGDIMTNEEKILQILSAMQGEIKGINSRLDKVDSRLDKVEQQQTQVARNTITLMDAEFRPQFGLLADELSIIKERLPNPEELEKMQEELDLHHAILKQHTREIQQLKRAKETLI